MESSLCNLDALIQLLESKKFITGFNNGSNIFVFTDRVLDVEKICKKFSLTYDVFMINNTGLCCV